MTDSRFATYLFAALLAASAMGAEAQTCPPGNPRVAPDSRYVNHGDGTVTDQQTGLMWKRCSEGQSGASCAGNPMLMTWQAALQAAASSNFAGHSDWRLPSVKELTSLIETGCHSPPINTNLFPNTPDGSFWTSTSYASSGSFAWFVSFFGSGGFDGDFNLKSFEFDVRLVRAGQ